MKKQCNFSESEDWKKIVLKTYSLRSKMLYIQNKKINLFGNGSYVSNSPYITDGGFFNFQNPLENTDFEGINQPVLLKTREKLVLKNNVSFYLDTNYFTYVLDLSQGKDFVWNKLVKSKTRNQVRKTEKCGYTFKIGKTGLLDDFYYVISKAWRDLGTPTHSKSFYRNIVEGFSQSDYNAEFIVLYINDEPASAACIIYGKDYLYHPYAATLKKFNKYSLNNALYWNIIMYAIQKRVKYFDLGRSRRGQSTVSYKLSWGAQQVQLYYYYFNKTTHKNDEDSLLIKLLINLWKKLPLPIANFLGPKLIYKILK